MATYAVIKKRPTSKLYEVLSCRFNKKLIRTDFFNRVNKECKQYNNVRILNNRPYDLQNNTFIATNKSMRFFDGVHVFEVRKLK